MDYQKLIYEFGDIQYEIAKLKELSTIFETTKGENLVLSYLMQRRCNVNPKEISQELNLTSARVAAVLKKLEERNFLERFEDPENHRQTLVRVLPEGEAYHQTMHDNFSLSVRELLEMLGKEDAVNYLRIRGRIVSYYKDKNKRQGGD